jgi:1-acyl-sn-glycerol-3-phosphate acyltransferase
MNRATGEPPPGKPHPLLAAFGWTFRLTPPPGPKAVVIFYPHTSNWDFPLGILARASSALPLYWVGKHTLFRGPLGSLFRRLGGLPVDRTASVGMVDQLRAHFDAHASFFLALAPEGTRSRVEHWKTGFYQIARAAQVPVGLGYIDYGRREIGIDTWLPLSGDIPVDLARIADAYRDKRGLHPEQASPIRFRDSAPSSHS